MTILLFASSASDQTRALDEAAHALAVDLVYVTDRRDALDEPWRDRAIVVSFSASDAEVAASLRAMHDATRECDVRGVLAVGDRPVLLTARAAQMLGVPWHTPDAARISLNPLLTRGRLLAAGLPVPWFFSMPLDARAGAGTVADRVRFPCAITPLGVPAGSHAIHADTPDAFDAALARLRPHGAASPDAGFDQSLAQEPFQDEALIEGVVEGPAYALEGVLEGGAFRVLTILDASDSDSADPSVTPAAVLTRDEQYRIAGTIAHAASAMGFRHGPVHADCRVNAAGVFVRAIAARPIDGRRARALRFVTPEGTRVSLEYLLIQHAVAGSLEGYGRDAS
jgi:hypothetical protein